MKINGISKLKFCSSGREQELEIKTLEMNKFGQIILAYHFDIEIPAKVSEQSALYSVKTLSRFWIV